MGTRLSSQLFHNMASLRLRRTPGLGPGLALPKTIRTLQARSFSALRTKSTPRQPCLTGYRAAALPTYASLSRYQQFSTSPAQYGEVVIKVPQMAESISEGTLSTFSKQVGDSVDQDEEVASIETDKIDVSVNAPEAGKITELLVNEGDTVTVGQEIAKMETGAGGGEGAKEGGTQKRRASSTSEERRKARTTQGREEACTTEGGEKARRAERN